MATYTATARDLATELAVDLSDRITMETIECGLHSGFPRCCIAFFVKTWRLLFVAINQAPRGEGARARRGYNAYLRQTRGTNYVPCPNCLSKRRFVNVKACDCEVKRQRALRNRSRKSRP